MYTGMIQLTSISIIFKISSEHVEFGECETGTRSSAKWGSLGKFSSVWSWQDSHRAQELEQEYQKENISGNIFKAGPSPFLPLTIFLLPLSLSPSSSFHPFLGLDAKTLLWEKPSYEDRHRSCRNKNGIVSFMLDMCGDQAQNEVGEHLRSVVSTSVHSPVLRMSIQCFLCFHFIKCYCIFEVKESMSNFRKILSNIYVCLINHIGSCVGS